MEVVGPLPSASQGRLISSLEMGSDLCSVCLGLYRGGRACDLLAEVFLDFLLHNWPVLWLCPGESGI